MNRNIPDIRSLTRQLAEENRRVQARFLTTVRSDVDALVDAYNRGDWAAIDQQTRQLHESAKNSRCDEIAQAASEFLQDRETTDTNQRTRALMKLISACGRQQTS